MRVITTYTGQAKKLSSCEICGGLVALTFPSSRLFHYIQLDLRRHFYLTPEG